MTAVIEFLNKLASKGVKLSAEAGRLNCYAQKGVLTDEIRNGIAKYKPDIIALLEGSAGRLSPQAGKTPSRHSKEFPLSAGQKRLYILHKLHCGLSANNTSLCL